MSASLRWAASGWRLQVMLFVISFVVLELVCRKRLRSEGIEHATRVARFDARTGFRADPRQCPDVNSDSLRCWEVSGPPALGHARVMCLGGSVTYGNGVSIPQTYEMQLQPMLGQAVGSSGVVEVINAGQVGFGIFQNAALYFDLAAKYQPCIVTALIGYNEPYNELKGEIELPAGAIELPRTRMDHVRTQLHRLALYRYMEAHIKPSRPLQRDPALMKPQPFAPLSTRNVRRFARVLRQNGIGFVLGIEALRSWDTIQRFDREGVYHAVYGHSPEEYGALRTSLKELGAEMQFPVVDMNDVLAASGHTEDELFQPRDAVHITQLGNRLYAEAFARAIVSIPAWAELRARLQVQAAGTPVSSGGGR